MIGSCWKKEINQNKYIPEFNFDKISFIPLENYRKKTNKKLNQNILNIYRSDNITCINAPVPQPPLKFRNHTWCLLLQNQLWLMGELLESAGPSVFYRGSGTRTHDNPRESTTGTPSINVSLCLQFVISLAKEKKTQLIYVRIYLCV